MLSEKLTVTIYDIFDFAFNKRLHSFVVGLYELARTTCKPDRRGPDVRKDKERQIKETARVQLLYDDYTVVDLSVRVQRSDSVQRVLFYVFGNRQRIFNIV